MAEKLAVERGLGCTRFLLFDMLSKPRQHFTLSAVGEFLYDLAQRKMDDVMVVDFLGGKPLAELQPHLVNQIHLAGCEVGRMGTQDVVISSPGWGEYFQVELRSGSRQSLPGKSDLARLLCGGEFRRTSQYDPGRLEILCSPQDSIPHVVRGDEQPEHPDVREGDMDRRTDYHKRDEACDEWSVREVDTARQPLDDHLQQHYIDVHHELPQPDGLLPPVPAADYQLQDSGLPAVSEWRRTASGNHLQQQRHSRRGGPLLHGEHLLRDDHVRDRQVNRFSSLLRDSQHASEEELLVAAE